MEPISKKYTNLIMKMLESSRAQLKVSDDNVYQPSNKTILGYIDQMIAENLLPGSEIRDYQNIEKLYEFTNAGKACLVLPEHYSNFDLPVFHYLLRKQGGACAQFAEMLIAIAGYKLNETNPVVAAFSEAYSRIVIYPSRSLEIITQKLMDPKELVKELMKSREINHAAMKALNEMKYQGHSILVFPAGTRYRPWDPSTKKGVREIDSYIRSFDYMVLVSINGNMLQINPEGEMHEDLIGPEKIVFKVSEPIACHEFREHIKDELHFRDDKKQAVVDAIMERLDKMHEAVEKSLTQ